ncbi:family 43 glycosylhydrolase [Isoptericola croceus]|uniref:family 43 glycosylhydrolase n=1 Tax=Isoptericola croceus TaxID=3031406 RepID=UPI0023F6E207|nr:family 43 glycosylhydrolase [Isoptericola croceus]
MRLVNPVVRGFAPDPSMIRVGDWYYLATSSFEWFPTIPLFRSRDLVHWEPAGSVDTAAPGGSLLGVPDSGGIWAPALSHADGHFWVVYSIVRSVGTRFFDTETYVCTAPDVGGPWSAPARVSAHGFDPSLFHHEGRHYLLNLQNDCRVGGKRFGGIVLTELEVPTSGGAPDVSRARAVGPTSLLLQRDELVEGPKITVRDGWFYLLLAQGGTGVEHGVLVARSRDLAGPYEVDEVPLMTTRDDPSVALQKAGHGELVQTPGGEWFCAHLASRPVQTPDGPRNPLGRETALQPVEWVDGWPRLAHGGWHPHVEIEVPDVGARPAELVTADAPRGFEGAPGWPWSTLREPPGSWCDTTDPERLRLRGRMGPESLWQQSFLGQRLTEHVATVDVVVEARPRTFTESAGLVLRYNATSYLQLHVTWAEPPGEPQAGQQWVPHGAGRRVLVLEQGHPDGARVRATVDAPDGAVHLRAEIDGAVARFLACPAGGVPRPVGLELDMSELSDDFGPRLRFTGTLAGVSAVDLVDAQLVAEFRGWSLRATPEHPFVRQENVNIPVVT